MNMMIKKVIFSLCVFNSLQLFSMEMELPKTSNDDSWFKNTILFCNGMQRDTNSNHIGMPKDVFMVIAQQSYLLRKKEVYKKFDPFFRFNNESYHKMEDDWHRNKNKFITENPDLNDDDIKKFNELYPDNFDSTCRQFNIIQPNDLLFFTNKQDEILSSLLFVKKEDGTLCLLKPSSKPFHNHKGSFSLQLSYEDNEQYKMLPNEFKEKLEYKYPKFVSPKLSHKKTILDEKSYSDEIF